MIAYKTFTQLIISLVHFTYLKKFVGLLPLLDFEATASNWLVELVQLAVEFHLKILHKLLEGS